MGEHVEKAEDARNRGNESQILWTGVNCLANAVGVAAIFLPGEHFHFIIKCSKAHLSTLIGLNVPLIVAGVGGSLIGVYKRIESDNKNKKEFADIMKNIEEHSDYKMISFSDVITQKQKQFEESRTHLMEHYNFNGVTANIVATLQMIIDSMLTNMVMPRQQQQGIQTEITFDILSQIKNAVGVAFQKYGRHMFNLMDDTIFNTGVVTAKSKILNLEILTSTFSKYFP